MDQNDAFEWDLKSVLHGPAHVKALYPLCFFHFTAGLTHQVQVFLQQQECVCVCLRLYMCVCVCVGECLSHSPSLALCLSVSLFTSLPLYISVFSLLFLHIPTQTYQAQPGATVFLTKSLVKDPTMAAQKH